jgi:hypothetical protein
MCFAVQGNWIVFPILGGMTWHLLFTVGWCPSPRQSLIGSRSFGRPITALTAMREAVATYTTRVAVKLHRGQRVAGALSVFLLTNRCTDAL